MQFADTKEIRDHLKVVSLDPAWSILALIIISTILSLVMSIIIDRTYGMSGGMFTATLITMIVVVSLLLFQLGKIQIETGHKGVLTVLDKRRLEDNYPLKKWTLLDEGSHWLVPGLCGAISVSFLEDSTLIENAVAKVPIDPKQKQRKDGVFEHATFIDIKFSKIQVQFMVSDPTAFINTGVSGLEQDLKFSTEEALRDVVIGTNTKDVYSAKINIEILNKIRSRKDAAGKPDIERWGIFPISVSAPGIDPESDEVKKALEGEYLEILNRLKETAEADTLATVFETIRKAAPNASDEFNLSVAMRMIKGLTKAGQDVFIHTNGAASNASVDGTMFGVAAAVINQNKGGTTI